MKLLFHYPGPFHDRLDSGEKKRPVMMYRAFQELGYEVETLTGERVERARQWPSIERRLKEFDFLYSENSTLPLGLTGAHHLPTFRPVDYRMFRAAKAAGVPAGVFYRDVYWKFPTFREEIGAAKFAASKWFYRSELALYRKTCRRVFVPSEPFIDMVPELPLELMEPLPPANDPVELSERPRSQGLWLIYVGSIRPPIYDISPLLAAMESLAGMPVNLTICTRPADLEQCRDTYRWPEDVSVVHYTGDRLSELLQAADISVMVFPPEPYRDLAMPLKLFEAIGHGLPVAASGPTAVSRFVDKHRLGWQIAPGELADLLKYILQYPDELEDTRKRVLAARSLHTWTARARQVAESLAPEHAAAPAAQ